MKTIDLRSDTATRPTPAMRRTMLTAEVGDDMSGEDPTVNRLEAMVAELLGMEAAVFTCSGTQSNQMGVRTHCLPGDELLIHETGHIANFEAGGAAALSGVTVRGLSGERGLLDVTDLDGKVRANDQHLCRTRLVCLENTTNLGGGAAYPLEQLRRVSAWARSHGLRVHLDGARFFNATVARGYSPADVAACFDTVSICFSKGLGCPMGSILAGSAADITRARRIRKLFGGALRQAGIVAATAIYALENNVARLAEDHRNARRLASLLAQIPGVFIDAGQVETNLVFFEIAPELGTGVQLSAALKDHGVRIGASGGQRVRAVTHLDVTGDDIDEAASVIATCLARGVADRPLVGSGPYAR